MASNSKKLKTFNVKKDQKLQAKKRKLEAFLNLVRKDEANFTAVQKKKPNGSFQESYKALKDELRKYQTKKPANPSLFLTDHGQNALVNFSANDIKCVFPLFVEDIYHLLLKSLLANMSPFPLRWSQLECPKAVSKTVLIEIGGLSQADFLEMNSELNQKSNIFSYVFEIVSSKIPFATELSTLHLSTKFCNEVKENDPSLLPIEKDADKKTKKADKNDKVSKLHLLLSPIQQAMEHFPLPQSVFEQSNSNDYCFTKESYTPVTSDSPMFALDCEMCKVVSGRMDVTRIAIVNENLETVYHTLVKPKLIIIDYITRFSGVTKSMLEKVTTTLDDVHAEIRRILPSDAILCGQSLNCDLHALKMIHPYVIDTSVIFNEHGVRSRKTSLKHLAKKYLKETIQNSKSGHHPIEDSIATMKLVQLKLKNCIKYGDSVLGSNTNKDTKNSSEDNSVVSKDSVLHGSSKFSDFVKLNTGPEHCGFFERISKFSKKVCLIGNEDALGNYCFEKLPDSDNIVKVPKSSNKKIFKLTSSSCLDDYDLIISHLVLKEENSSVAEVNNSLKEVFNTVPNKTLFLVIGSVDKSEDESFKHSYCMAVLKNVNI